jgi:intraflagellar transport protein 140
MLMQQSYRKAGSQTRCAFLPAQTVDVGNTASSMQLTSFFFGGEAGIVYYADDVGHCTEVVPAFGGPLDVLEVYLPSSRLVAVSRSLIMVQYDIGRDGKLTPLMRVKVSMKGSIASHTWASGGVLVTVSADEPHVRCWDVVRDEPYSFSLFS